MNKNSFFGKICMLALAIATIPFSVFGASQSGTDLNGVARFVNRVLAAVIPLLIGITLVSFIWGIFVYIWHGDDEDMRKESKDFMLWGVIGLFFMVSLWGIVSLFANTLNFHLPGGLVPSLPNKQF